MQRVVILKACQRPGVRFLEQLDEIAQHVRVRIGVRRCETEYDRHRVVVRVVEYNTIGKRRYAEGKAVHAPADLGMHQRNALGDDDVCPGFLHRLQRGADVARVDVPAFQKRTAGGGSSAL